MEIINQIMEIISPALNALIDWLLTTYRITVLATGVVAFAGFLAGRYLFKSPVIRRK